MKLEPYICKCCGGRINVAKMRCEYCGTPYKDESLKRLVIQQVQPGVNTIRAEVLLNREDILHNPERARDYALRELRNQLADGLLAYMRIATTDDARTHTQIIRGEVRVIDPVFDNY